MLVLPLHDAGGAPALIDSLKKEPGVSNIAMDGSKVILTLGRSNHIAIVDAHTKQVLSYVLVGKRAWGVGLSRDEKTAIVTNGLSDDITIVDMTTMKPVKSIPAGRTPHSVVIDD